MGNSPNKITRIADLIVRAVSHSARHMRFAVLTYQRSTLTDPNEMNLNQKKTSFESASKDAGLLLFPPNTSTIRTPTLGNKRAKRARCLECVEAKES